MIQMITLLRLRTRRCHSVSFSICRVVEGPRKVIWRRLVAGAMAMAVALTTGFCLVAAEETFATLSAGKARFTNVTVLNKTPTDLFIAHSHDSARPV